MEHGSIPMHEAVSAFKRTLVLEALIAHGGNRSRAAAALKIERTSLLRLIRELGISESSPDARRGRPRTSARQVGKNGPAGQARPRR
jgi:DNA-binding NtrC family response regulator